MFKKRNTSFFHNYTSNINMVLHTIVSLSFLKSFLICHIQIFTYDRFNIIQYTHPVTEFQQQWTICMKLKIVPKKVKKKHSFSSIVYIFICYYQKFVLNCMFISKMKIKSFIFILNPIFIQSAQ